MLGRVTVLIPSHGFWPVCRQREASGKNLEALGTDLEDNTTRDLGELLLYEFLSFYVYDFYPSSAGPLKHSGKGEGKKSQSREEEEEEICCWRSPFSV